MKMPRTRRRLPIVPIILGVMVAALLVAGLTGWQRWRQLETTGQTRTQAVRQAFVTATDPQVERAVRMQAVDRLAEYDNEPLVCEGAWWYGWLADVLPNAKQAAEKCMRQQAIINPVTKHAAILTQYLEQEALLTPIIGSLVIDGTKPYWQSNAAAAAANAEKKLGAISRPSNAFKPTLETAKQQVKTISTRWRVLNEASTKQDRKAYEAAIDGVDNAYSGLLVVADASDDAIADLLELLLEAGTKL